MRRTEYPVGSPAWIRLLANGGIEDISGLRNGVERKAAVSGLAVEPKPEVKVAAVEKPSADELLPSSAATPRSSVSEAGNDHVKWLHRDHQSWPHPDRCDGLLTCC
jgi:hypothetical protein